LRAAVHGVIEEARRTNSEVVVWENGAVQHVPASELPPTPASVGRESDKGSCTTKPPLPSGEG